MPGIYSDVTLPYLCLAILPLSRVVSTLLELVPCSSQLALRVQMHELVVILSAGKGVSRYLVPKWLLFLN
jgi:hypothetical protein